MVLDREKGARAWRTLCSHHLQIFDRPPRQSPYSASATINDQCVRLCLRLHILDMSRKITITYELNPPQGITAEGLSTTRTHELPVPDSEGSLKAYYDNVREAIAKGKDLIGEELTTWRDAVGNTEQSKELKTPSKQKDEDEEEDEEEEQE